MIDVTLPGLQGDAHLIRLVDGKNLLIDVGRSDKTPLDYLEKNEISVIHKVIITHAHKDHYGDGDRCGGAGSSAVFRLEPCRR